MSSSYSSLKNELAQYLLQYNTFFPFRKKEKNPFFKATIAIAGGGSSAISAITSTPNASSFLLEGIITYDRLSFANFLISASSSKKEVLVSSNQFKFSSPEAAYQLAHASLQKSLRYTYQTAEACENMNDDDLHQQLDHCIGVGCSSMLSSTPGTRKSKRDPHGNVCIMFADGSTFSLFVNMNLDGSIKANIDSHIIRRRDQDDILSCVILLSIIISMRNKITTSKIISLDEEATQNALNQLNNIIHNTIDELTSIKEEKTNNGPEIKVTFQPNPQTLLELSNDSMMKIENIVKTRANQIIHKESNAALLLPKQTQYSAMNTNHDTEKNHPISESFTSFQEPMIPMDSIIFPGSFNPMHKGHITLAYNAMKVVLDNRKKEYHQRSQNMNTPNSNEDDMISIWDAVLSSNSLQQSIKPPTVFFEMSVTNADKAPMDIDQVEKRTEWIIEEMSKYNDVGVSIDIPRWGVLLDSAPLFIQKVKLVESLLVSSSYSDQVTDETNKRKMTFVIGTDTLVRLLDIKYYDYNVENMLMAMRDMKKRGVHFVVGGRSQQGVDSKTPKFIDGSDEVTSQPSDIQEMFTLLKEEDFRVDMSSTEIRKERSLN